MKQGTYANYTGDKLQKFIFNNLVEKGYTLIDRKKFDSSKYLEQPIFATEYTVGKSIYETKIDCDFIIFHPKKFPNCLIIESKWQESTGSVDEKFPYLVYNIKKCYPCATIVVLDGGGYKKEAEQWLRKQVGGKLVKVLNMREFQKWSNSEEL
ncbi:MAG: hypothetical protein HY361_00045 [Candidatus Aenigmarchaeota archaeon]|nr:hypothetical protein [Candidatus Aenigmarchaeota archaeon]